MGVTADSVVHNEAQLRAQLHRQFEIYDQPSSWNISSRDAKSPWNGGQPDHAGGPAAAR